MTDYRDPITNIGWQILEAVTDIHNLKVAYREEGYFSGDYHEVPVAQFLKYYDDARDTEFERCYLTIEDAIAASPEALWSVHEASFYELRDSLPGPWEKYSPPLTYAPDVLGLDLTGVRPDDFDDNAACDNIDAIVCYLDNHADYPAGADSTYRYEIERDHEEQWVREYMVDELRYREVGHASNLSGIIDRSGEFDDDALFRAWSRAAQRLDYYYFTGVDVEISDWDVVAWELARQALSPSLV